MGLARALVSLSLALVAFFVLIVFVVKMFVIEIVFIIVIEALCGHGLTQHDGLGRDVTAGLSSGKPLAHVGRGITWPFSQNVVVAGGRSPKAVWVSWPFSPNGIVAGGRSPKTIAIVIAWLSRPKGDATAGGHR